MEPIIAYHITDISNIKSIITDGIIPNIGKNSRQVHEHNFMTFFTTYNSIDTWINRFNLDKSSIVVLKFKCTNYGYRYDNANDYFTLDTVLPDEISVIGEEEKTLKEYYSQNKDKIELELNKNILDDIKTLTERLDKIESAPLVPETGWDYNETEPNIVKTIDLLKSVRYLNDKKQYKNIIEKIKEKTLTKLINNDLGITENSKLYKSLDIIFADAVSDIPQISIMDLNYANQMLSINLYHRQLDRYMRTQKKFGDDNTIWQFDRINLDEIQSKLQNEYLKSLLNEIISLNKINDYKKM